MTTTIFAKRNLEITAIITVIVASVLLIAIGSSNSILAQQEKQQKSFNANLSGSSEVPPTSINATGNAEFQVATNKKELTYSLNVKDLEGITEAHIHKGKVGENGPVILTLYKSKSPSIESNTSLTIKETVTSAKLEGPLAGKQLPDLITIMNNGTAYVNVHTEQNPLGAIRGQILSAAGT